MTMSTLTRELLIPMFVAADASPEANGIAASAAAEAEAAYLEARTAIAKARQTSIGEGLRDAIVRIGAAFKGRVAAIDRHTAALRAATTSRESTLWTGIAAALRPSSDPREIALRREIRDRLLPLNPLQRRLALIEAARNGDLMTLAAVGEVQGTPLRMTTDDDLQMLHRTAAERLRPEAAKSIAEAEGTLAAVNYARAVSVRAAASLGIAASEA